MKRHKSLYLALSSGLVVLYVLIALAWAAFNLTAEPQYGDTPEYWQIAKTLIFDSWRTIGYPLVVRAASLVGSIDYQHAAVYAFQTALSVAALWVFFGTLRLAARRAPNVRHDLILATLVVCTPVVAHFNFSILSDSVATSLFVIGGAALLRLAVLKTVTPGAMTLALVGIAGSGLVRQDRLLCFAVILVGLAIWMAMHRRYTHALAVGLLLLACVGTIQLNRLTQSTIAGGRPAISAPFLIFDRTVRGRLSQLMPDMPSVIRARITPADASHWDESITYSAVVADKLSDAPGQAAMVSGALTAVRHHGLSIAAHGAVEAAQYLVTPVTYVAFTIAPQLPGAESTSWTYSRMANWTPDLTLAYVAVFVALMLIAVVVAFKRFPPKGLEKLTAVYWLFVVAVITAVHVGTSSLGFHLRYALPIFYIEIGLLVWLLYDLLHLWQDGLQRHLPDNSRLQRSRRHPQGS